MTRIVDTLNGIAWGPWMLILLVGTGIYLTARLKLIQFGKFGYTVKNTIGKMFGRQKAGKGEVTPFQAVSTALAATVGTGNIAGVTGAIVVGGPGAVFWMWVTALVGMATKYAEVVLAVRYRERNEKGDWVGGPMYYIKNGMGKKWKWLAVVFCVLAALAAFGIGNMTQVNTIAGSIGSVFSAFTDGATATFTLFGQQISWISLIVGILVAVIVALVLFGGIKRIGSVAEKMVPFMAAVYILASLAVVVCNFEHIGSVFTMIFQGAFNADAALGGATGIVIMTTIQKGVGRGVFSNEAGLGSAPMAHAATSETDPVKQGLYGIFEVFMDTIVICTLTAVVLLCGAHSGVDIAWGTSGGAELIGASFATVFGAKAGSLIVAVGITLFALSTILSWSLYGSRCCEFLLGQKAVKPYQLLFVAAVIVGATLELNLVWNIADTLNGFMAIPNLIALLALSGVVAKMTRDHFKAVKLKLGGSCMQDIGMQFHIHCKEGDVGRYCFLPGDPGRCEAIAAHFDNPVHVGMNREYNIYTGTLLGEKVSVCSTGIGGPSASIAMEELAAIGADTFIRVGTTGGIALDVCPGDVVVATGAIRYEHTSLEYAPIEYPAVADFDITAALKAASEDLGYKTHVGIVQCKDAFYGQHAPERSPVYYDLQQKWESWKRLGVKSSEMESAALFVVANALNVRCGSCFHVVWNQEREKLGMQMPMTEDTSGAIKVGIEAMKRIIAADLKKK